MAARHKSSPTELSRLSARAQFMTRGTPGPVFVMVTTGTLTYYDADDPAEGIDYEAGTGFVDQGGDHVHDARNHGDVDVELVAFFLTPHDTPIRIDAPAP